MKKEKMKKENLKRRSLKRIVLDPKAKNRIPMLHLKTGEEETSGTCVKVSVDMLHRVLAS